MPRDEEKVLPCMSPHREAPNRHEKGSAKYKEWVRKGSKLADNRNLSFTFSKPKRCGIRNCLVYCTNCGNQSAVTETTVAVICSSCKQMYRVTEDNKEFRQLEKVDIFIGGDSNDNK